MVKNTILCKKCKQSFLAYENGKNFSNRKYCLICVPFGKRLKNNTYFTNKICNFCGKNYIYDRKKGHKAKCCNSCHTVGRHIAKKKRALEYKGSKCVQCGYNKYYGALDFHHIDPEKKEFQFGHNWSRKWKVLQKELDKCVILCRNCHAETHDKMRRKNDESL